MKGKRAFWWCVVFTMLAAVFFLGSAVAQNRTLYWGSSGADVKKVQSRLSDWGYFKGPIDSYYGATTFNAVKDFQRKNGLAVDGVCGPRTWAALGYSVAQGQAQGPAAAPANQADAGVSRGVTNRGDVYLLAKVIEGEAADEPYTGKVAVGAVMMNRVQSASFPNTLAGVVYQPHAFESVTNGQYNRPTSEESIKAAQQAMNGWDPSGGALFFWNPSKPVSAWIWTRSIINTIGNHVFAR